MTTGGIEVQFSNVHLLTPIFTQALIFTTTRSTADALFNCVQVYTSYDTAQQRMTRATAGVVIKMVDQAHTLLSFLLACLRPKTDPVKINPAIASSTVNPQASDYCRSASAATIMTNLTNSAVNKTPTAIINPHQSDPHLIQSMQQQSKSLFNLNTNLEGMRTQPKKESESKSQVGPSLMEGHN